jgi:hypothetical protein
LKQTRTQPENNQTTGKALRNVTFQASPFGWLLAGAWLKAQIAN